MELQVYKGMGFKPYPLYSGTSVCLAGAEAREYMNVFIESGVESVLASFFYLRRKFKRSRDLINRLQDEYSNFQYIFMDSGGYTLQQEKRRGKLKVSLEDYIKEYKDFAMEMQGHITVFGAVDSVDDKYTYDDYIKHLYDFKDNGIHIAPTVWIDTKWKTVVDSKLTENFDIIGLSGARFDRNKAIKQFYNLKKAGTKVHGYAATSQEHFLNFKFFSVDSISWLSAQRHALTFDYRGGKMRTISPYMKMETRRYLLSKVKDGNIDKEAILLENQLRKTKQTVPQEVSDEINKLNLMAWVELAKAQKHNAAGNYWDINDDYEYIEV